MNQDTYEKRNSKNKIDSFYDEDKNDPVYRRKNGQHSRNVAKSLSARKKALHRHNRRTGKYSEINGHKVADLPKFVPHIMIEEIK